jgi:hemerythrin-like metal-binding protein
MEWYVYVLTTDDEMSVGIPEIDEDHKKLLTLILELNQSITYRKSVDEIKHRLQLIVADAERHFSLEERLFKECNYPNADAHAANHAQALHALKNIMHNFEPYGNDSGWVDASLRIRDILMEHIHYEDMKYAAHHRNSGHVDGGNKSGLPT